MTVIPMHGNTIKVSRTGRPSFTIEIPRTGRPIVGLISTLNPVAALITTVQSLLNEGAYRVIVVDDGSYKYDSQIVLETLKGMDYVTVIHLPENGGKSSALREGFLALPEDERIIIIQTDDDTRAGALYKPAQMIKRGKADIVDIRVETYPGQNVVGLVQELDYWLINAFIKRLQDLLRARLWVSGASMMYTYEAAKVLLLPQSYTRTEDTEGRFRAIKAGLRLRYCAGRKAAFKTMVPESMAAVRTQWQRWALGNGQVIKLHGLGGGSKWIATVNLLSWIEMLVSPILQFFAERWTGFLPWTPHVPGLDAVPQYFLGNLLTAIVWIVAFGIVIGIAGAITLRRWQLAFVGVFVPLLSLWWAFHAIEGIAVAQKHPTAKQLTWTPPKRMVA